MGVHMKDTLITLSVEMRANPGKFRELHQTLEAFLPMIRSQNGCRDCRISRDIEDGEVLVLVIYWACREDLDHYIRSEDGSALLGAVEVLSETSKVGFGKDAVREGIDALKKIRRKNVRDEIEGGKKP